MNIEEFREFCLSLGEVEEKLPFAKMPGGDTLLVFYVSGHTFCYCDLREFTAVVKCQTERIAELLGTANGVEPPDNHFNPKYWLGINLQTIDTEFLQELVRNSFEIVKRKNERKREKKH